MPQGQSPYKISAIQKVKNEVFGSRLSLAAARCKGSKRATYIKLFMRLPCVSSCKICKIDYF